MKKIIFLSFLFISVTIPAQVAGQETRPRIVPTPQVIYWDYTVLENQGDIMTAITGERNLFFEMQIGKKSLNKALLAELKKSGIPIRRIKPSGITVSYPEAMDDCHILADAAAAARIVLRHLPKKYELRFNGARMKNNYFQTVPPQCGAEPGAARSLLAALPFYTAAGLD